MTTTKTPKKPAAAADAPAKTAHEKVLQRQRQLMKRALLKRRQRKSGQ